MLLLPAPPALEAPARIAALCGLCGFHAGIWATCRLGPIPFINMAVLLPFVPSTVWERRRHRDVVRLTIGSTEPEWRAIARCAAAELLAALQGGSVSLERATSDGDSRPARAIRRAARSRSRDARDTDAGSLRRDADARDTHGAPPLPGWPSVWVPAAWQLLLCWTMAGTLCWNLGGLAYGLGHHGWSVPQTLAVLPLLALNLHQAFDVFAPRPVAVDFYYSLPATLRNGSRLDLGSVFERYGRLDLGRAPTWTAPPSALPFTTNRWRRCAARARARS
jgi:hypothetical protein